MYCFRIRTIWPSSLYLYSGSKIKLRRKNIGSRWPAVCRADQRREATVQCSARTYYNRIVTVFLHVPMPIPYKRWRAMILFLCRLMYVGTTYIDPPPGAIAVLVSKPENAQQWCDDRWYMQGRARQAAVSRRTETISDSLCIRDIRTCVQSKQKTGPVWTII